MFKEQSAVQDNHLVIGQAGKILCKINCSQGKSAKKEIDSMILIDSNKYLDYLTTTNKITNLCSHNILKANRTLLKDNSIR